METHSSIQYLNKLEILSLEKCKSLRSLPTSIHSKYLLILDISDCSNLKNFPEITSCHMWSLELTEVGIKELPSSIEGLSNLKELHIKDCSELESISSSIFKLKSLESIEISNCSNLKRFLEIPSCNMDGGTGIEQLASCKLVLEKCSSLESLPSSLFKFACILELTEVGIKELPSSIECLSNLKELYIKDCSELESISSSIFKLKSLESIGISNCSKLKRFLEIPSCNIDGGTGIEQLALCKLVLETCSSLESLPSSLCMFKSLTSLEIVDCQNFKRLPDELGNLEALEALTVNGTAIREVPESLGQLSSLENLVLANNNLERLPESLSQLSSLEYLHLSGNSLEGILEYLRSLQSKLTSLKVLSVEFRNCLKLDPKELIEIAKDEWMKQSFHGNINSARSIYFRGNEIPKWFRNQSMRIFCNREDAASRFPQYNLRVL